MGESYFTCGDSRRQVCVQAPPSPTTPALSTPPQPCREGGAGANLGPFTCPCSGPPARSLASPMRARLIVAVTISSQQETATTTHNPKVGGFTQSRLISCVNLDPTQVSARSTRSSRDPGSFLPAGGPLRASESSSRLLRGGADGPGLGPFRPRATATLSEMCGLAVYPGGERGRSQLNDRPAGAVTALPLQLWGHRERGAEGRAWVSRAICHHRHSTADFEIPR